MSNMETKVFEYPQDIWGNIMDYFHSAYRKPTHYEAIVNFPHFAKRRRINRAWQGSSFVEEYSVFVSYYITIVADCWVYCNNPDLDIIIPPLNLNSRVASGNVLKDFKKIFLEYSKNNYETHILSKISY